MNKESEIFILGNGPSLKESLEINGALIEKKNCLCVNNFAVTPFYEKIKPQYYLLLDPVYWESGLLDIIIQERESVFSAINKKTHWPLNIFLPGHSRKRFDWYGTLTNPNISIVFFNATALSGYNNVIHFLYERNYGMPHPQNVLVAAIFLAINMNYKHIYLLGADHSWHEDLALNDENVVCCRDKHFYDKSIVQLSPWYKGDKAGTTWKMHEILHALALMFVGYHYIKEYACYKGATILNASNISYIDAFKKCTTMDLHEYEIKAEM
jgi:hypothetical protein